MPSHTHTHTHTLTLRCGCYSSFTSPFLSLSLSQKSLPSEVQDSLREVVLMAQRLNSECKSAGHTDLAFHTRHIVNCAYDVAKAARQLISCVEQTHAQS